MNTDHLLITKAVPSNVEDIFSLLSEVNLPHEGVLESLDNFLVARDTTGRILGCIGMERHGRLGLLRSAAISPALQRAGLGSRLTAALLESAAGDGVDEMTLLTTTAKEFFARKFGFIETDRADYNERLAHSPEWNLPRCSSAAFMRLDLRHY